MKQKQPQRYILDNSMISCGQNEGEMSPTNKRKNTFVRYEDFQKVVAGFQAEIKSLQEEVEYLKDTVNDAYYD